MCDDDKIKNTHNNASSIFLAGVLASSSLPSFLPSYFCKNNLQCHATPGRTSPSAHVSNNASALIPLFFNTKNKIEWCSPMDAEEKGKKEQWDMRPPPLQEGRSYYTVRSE
jgi:hypothetical protein